MSGHALFGRLTNGPLREKWRDERITPMHCEGVLRAICKLVAKAGVGLAYHLPDGSNRSPDELVRIVTYESGRMGASNQIYDAIDDLVRLGYIAVTVEGSVYLQIKKARTAPELATDDGQLTDRAVNARFNGTRGGVGDEARNPMTEAIALLGPHDPAVETLIEWKRRYIAARPEQKKGTARRGEPIAGQGAFVSAGFVGSVSPPRFTEAQQSTVQSPAVSEPSLGSTLNPEATQPGLPVRTQMGLDLGSAEPVKLASFSGSSILLSKLASSGEYEEPEATAEPENPELGSENPPEDPDDNPPPGYNTVLSEQALTEMSPPAAEAAIAVLVDRIAVLAGLHGNKQASGPALVGKWLTLPFNTPKRMYELAQEKVAANQRARARKPDVKPIGSFEYFDEAMCTPPKGAQPVEPVRRKPTAAESFTRPASEPVPRLPAELRGRGGEELSDADVLRTNGLLALWQAGKIEEATARLRDIKANRKAIYWRLSDYDHPILELIEPSRAQKRA